LKDEHLWPGDGNIDWATTVKALKQIATPPAAVLEIHHSFGSDTHAAATHIEQAFTLFD
jgi:sugar phosphate isomerase/epimerase